MPSRRTIISYEAAAPPDDLTDDMQALPGATLRFLSIKAIDGFKVQAALWQPDNRPPAETTIILQVHGSGGNLASLPLRVTARAQSAKGYAALNISTRQHDENVNTDNFFDVRRDIEAAVVTAKARRLGCGWRRNTRSRCWALALTVPPLLLAQADEFIE